MCYKTFKTQKCNKKKTIWKRTSKQPWPLIFDLSVRLLFTVKHLHKLCLTFAKTINFVMPVLGKSGLEITIFSFSIRFDNVFLTKMIKARFLKTTFRHIFYIFIWVFWDFLYCLVIHHFKIYYGHFFYGKCECFTVNSTLTLNITVVTLS